MDEFMCTECNQNCHGAAQDFCICLDCRKELEAENERLRAVYEAVKDIKWRSIDKDNMEFSTTCFAVDRIREALAAVEGNDDALYGYCPVCGSKGYSRERRPNGNDRCINGHEYPSSKALTAVQDDNND